MVMRTTFSRNGLGWAFGPERSLDEFAADVMRREYDPATGALLGTLIEEQRINLLRDCYAPITSSWSGSVTATEGGPGLGSRPGYTLTDDSENDAQTINQTNSIDALPATYTATFYISKTLDDSRYVGIDVRLRNSDVVGDKRHLGIFSTYTGEFTAYFQNDGIDRVTSSGDFWYITVTLQNISAHRTIEYRIYPAFNADGSGNARPTATGSCGFGGGQIEAADFGTRLILTESSARTRAPDFFDAPGALNEYGPSLHTWRNAVRMSRDPGEPTIIGSAEHRIYAKNGRLVLDGPGELIQPDGEHAPGDYVPFVWNVQFPGAAPDFALGRAYGDSDWWNGHLVDIVPFPRNLTAAEINAWVGA